MHQEFENSIEVIEKKIKYVFKNKELLEQAFTRKSFAEENKSFDDNEVLEFIGDKVLDFLITKKLIERYGSLGFFSNKFVCDFDEGELTKMRSLLVRSDSLARAIDEQQLNGFLLMSKGDIKREIQNETHVKEDLFEAILGAIAIDSDWNIEILTEAVDTLLRPDERMDAGLEKISYVDFFQKLWEAMYPSTMPEYKYKIRDDGYYYCSVKTEDIHPFFVGIRQNEFSGIGKTKEEATMRTAKEAVLYLINANASRDKIKELVGDLEIDKAVNQLQELYQKKYIGKPNYEFYEGEKDENGNPVWTCICTVEETNIREQIGDAKKMVAKKAAAWFAIKRLMNNTYERD
jgi:ribonuclease-3